MGNKKQSTNHKRLLKLLGSKGKDAATPDQISEFKRIFKRLDADGDGKVTLQEYINRSKFKDKAKVRAIFHATARNGDGVMTEEEYIENRTITNEAKEIFNKIDKNRDGILTEQEFVENSIIADKDLARQIFRDMDVDGGVNYHYPDMSESGVTGRERIEESCVCSLNPKSLFERS